MEAEKIATGWIDPEHVSGFFAQSIAAQLRDMEYFGCAGKVLRYTAAQPIDARNQICKIFLEETDDDWLWMVDADMLFDQGHVMKLWETASEHGVKMVSGLAFINRPKVVPSIFYWKDEDNTLFHPYNHIPDEPSYVAATGLASLLVHRDVLESMDAPRHEARRWFDFLNPGEVGLTSSDPVGIDVQFCLRAWDAGYPMMVNPNARTRHLEDAIIDYETWREDWKES